MFKHILVPIDFSAPSDAALDYARTVARQFGATLHLLHVTDDPYRAFYSAEVYVPEVEGLREEILSDSLARLKGLLRTSDLSDLHAFVDRVALRVEARLDRPSAFRSNRQFLESHRLSQ